MSRDFDYNDVLSGAKAAWASRQSRYLIMGLKDDSIPPLKDWDDCPSNTKDWMMAEARSVLNDFFSRNPSKPHTNQIPNINERGRE